MVRKIPVTRELRDYVEMLQYEATRYSSLLSLVKRDACHMTQEEWDDSLAYYHNLCGEAKACLKYALEEVHELYKDAIGTDIWHINFAESVLVIGEKYTPPTSSGNKKLEQFSEKLHRLYPPETRGVVTINGSYAKTITLQVTDACNMACTYCYQHNKGNHSMSFETATTFLSMILDADERTNSYITSTKSAGVILDFIGGEPWLEIDLIARVSDWFVSELFRRKHPWAIKFCFNVCSNGLLHFDPRVQAYLKRHGPHLGYNISIDGNKQLHDACRVDLGGNGTFDRAMAGVRDYRMQHNRDIGSKMTISPANVDKVFSAVAYMIQDGGYTNIHLNCVYEEGWTLEHAHTLYWQLHQLTDWLVENGYNDSVYLSILDSIHCHPLSDSEEDNKNWCGGTGLMLAVDYKGDMYPCLRYMESSVGSSVEPYIIGTLKDGISRTEEHKKRIECFQCITRRSQSTDECYNCPIAAGCGWCSAYNYERFGTPNKRATFICDMHKARSLATVYHWRRLGHDFEMHCPKEWAVPIIGEKEYDNLVNMKGGELQ